MEATLKKRKKIIPGILYKILEFCECRKVRTLPCRSALDPHRFWAGGESTVDINRINNLHRSALGPCGSAPDLHRSWGEQIDSQHREDRQSMWISPGSTQILGEGQSTVRMERINSELLHGQFKRFNLCVLHVGFKSVLQCFISTKSCTLT